MFIVYKNAYEINKDTKVNRQYDMILNKLYKKGLEGNTQKYLQLLSLEGQTMGYIPYFAIYSFSKNEWKNFNRYNSNISIIKF